MAAGWYDRGKKDGKKADGAHEKRPGSIHERHAAEREETHSRHQKARDNLHKQHEEELAMMASRHNDELANAGPGEGAPGGEPAPAAMNNAAPGAAAGASQGVAGANAA